MRALFLGGLMALVATSAHAAVIIVNVYHNDFSINGMGDPVQDPTINVGDTIRWLFHAEPHTTTSVAGIPEVWASGFVPMDGTFDHTFTHIGAWEYYCSFHGFDLGNQTAGGMSGVVTVVVPEPATLFVLGSALLLPRRRR